jgi:hypothetical protein
MYLESSKYNSQLAETEAKTKGATSSMTSSTSKFAAVAQVGYIAAATAAAKFLVSSVQAAIEAEESQLKLASAVANSTDVTSASIPVFQAQAQAIRDLTGVDDDAINAMQGFLVQMGLTADQVSELTPLIVDLSQKFGVSLDTAAKAVGKSVNGTVGGLQKMGVVVDKTAASTDAYAATLDALGVVQGFAAEKAEAQPWLLLSSAFGELEERLGRELLPAIQELTPSLVPIAGFIGNVMGPVLESLGESAGALADALDALGVSDMNTADDQGILSKAWDFATSSSVDLGKKIYWLNPLLEDDAVAAHNAAEASTALKDDAVRLADAIAHVGDVQIDAAEKTREHTKAMREQRLETLNAADGILGLVANLQTVAEDERNLQHLRNQGKQGTAEYRQAVIDTTQDMLSLRIEMRNQAAQMKENGDRNNEIKRTLREMATQAGISGRDFRNALHGPLSDIFDDINRINQNPLSVKIAPGTVSGIQSVEQALRDTAARLGGK